MPEQLDIYGNAHPFPALEPRSTRLGDRGGSVDAAKIPDRIERYIELLRAFDVCLTRTDSELASSFPSVHPGTVSKRRLRLERAGLVEMRDYTRKTSHGVEAMVFAITDKGRGVLQEWETKQG